MSHNIFSNTFLAMGTRCDVVFAGVESELAEQVFHVLQNEIKYLEHRLSRFIPESPVSELNRKGKNIWIPIDDDLWEYLTVCFDFWQISNGAFDITSAPLITLWKQKIKAENISEEQIEKAKKICGFDKVEFDFVNKKIKYSVDGIEFDFGAIGKGIALDIIKPVLLKRGIKNAIVSFGESSILALGKHPNGDNWPLGIRNPENMNEFVHVFYTSNESVTTSGTILSSDDGKVTKRRHIISPADGKPVESDKTVSVKSESATLGEFLSTTWLILPENDKNVLCEKLKKIEILEVTYFEDDNFNTKLTVL